MEVIDEIQREEAGEPPAAGVKNITVPGHANNQNVTAISNNVTTVAPVLE